MRLGRLVSLILVVIVALEGCVVYPKAVPTSGQDAATVERDERACRERADHEIDSPLAAGFGTKIGSAIAGALVLGGVAAYGVLESGLVNDQPAVAGAAVGGAAGLGFLAGSVAGTFAGGRESLRRARARGEIFARCMAQRGYSFP